VNTKNISLPYLLANYLKFNAPSTIFHSTTKYLLQKELMGCKKKNSSIKERKRKIYEPKFVIKISSSKLEESFQVKEH